MEKPGSTGPPRSSARPQRPWYTYLNLDLILHILSRSLFHPFIILVFYLCLASVHKHRTTLATYTLYYALFLGLVDLCIYLNRRFTDGPARKVDWGTEVVVLTGGATGLGRCMLEMLAHRGISVAVLDVRGPDGEMEEWSAENGGCVEWYECDVGNEEQVSKVAKRIAKDLGQPTILINNAATPINGISLYSGNRLKDNAYRASLQAAQIKKTVGVNLLGYFNTLSAFIDSISSTPNGGTVVTVSSILAHLSPASLTDYAASKAAVSSLHHTLTNEIAREGASGHIKTILVEVGQMATDLFSKAQTPWYTQFVGPTLEVKDVAKEIVRLLDNGQGGIIRMPAYSKMMIWYGMLPGSLQRLVRWFSGIDKAFTKSRRHSIG